MDTAAGGFVLGILFLLLMDQLLPHLHAGSDEPEGISSSWKRTTLLVMAVTLHNIPEGWQWGWRLPWRRRTWGLRPVRRQRSLLPGNRYPELPGRSGDIPAFKAGRDAFLESVCLRQPFRNCGTDFRYSGCSDCRRNPAAYALLLSFAAGAMMYVVVEELIPEAHLGEHSNVGTWGLWEVSLL